MSSTNIKSKTITDSDSRASGRVPKFENLMDNIKKNKNTIPGPQIAVPAQAYPKKKRFVEEVVGDAPWGLSGEEWAQAHAILLYSKEGELLDEGICPTCGSPKIKEWYVQSGPDDFDKQAECSNCGDTWG